MSGRSTAEIVADLRAFVDYYGCDPGVPMSAVDAAAEAADRLAELASFPPHDGQGPDVDPATGDERETTDENGNPL